MTKKEIENKEEIEIPKDDIPSHWAWAKLNDICNPINGKTFKSSEWRESGLPIIRIQNLKNPNAFYNYFQGELNENFLVKKGDLLFAWSGTPGTSFGAHIWFGKDAALNQHIFNVRFDKESINTKYFCYALNQNVTRYVEQAQGGVGLAHITKGKFQNSFIPLAPLNEQKCIVAEIEKQFSRLDEAVGNLKRVKANLKRYKASVLKAAVEGKLTEEWREKHPDVEPADKLLECILVERRKKWEEAELAKMKAKGKVPKNYKWKKKYKEPAKPELNDLPSLPDSWVWVLNDTISFVTKLAGFEYTKFVKYDDFGDLAVIKAENAGKDGFKRTNFSKVKSAKVSHLTRSQIVPGDLLMVFVGAGTGNVARVPDDQPYFLGPNIGMIRVESQLVSSDYLELFLRSPIGNSLSLGFAKAVAQPSLSMGNIRKIPIAVPSLSEQKIIFTEVESILTNIDKTELVVDANLQRADCLRQSILRKAFSGQLRASKHDAKLE